jgi:iron complex outermembrane receptor protein
MKKLIALILVLGGQAILPVPPALAGQAILPVPPAMAGQAGLPVLHGVVRDAAGQPIAGAIVAAQSSRAITDASGAFALESAGLLHVVHPGFQPLDVAASDGVEIVMRPVMAEVIVVSGIRAEAATPVTKTDVPREEIERRYYQQDIPLLLRDTPAINAYSESGAGGAGYSYISLRGIGPTRLNFTLDGVPLADSEDMGTYFADFPDLAHSLQSVQIQRGVGTSTVGSPSFGGSINLQSIDLAQSEATEARVAAGSFGAKFATVGWQSGFRDGFAMYARASAQESDGFRRSSGMRQRNLFVSAAKQNEDSQLRFTGFTAHERTQQSFLATDLDTLRQDLRFNPLSADDKDSFGYDLAQLQYLKALSPSTDMTASVFYQRGYGWYQLLDDEATHTGLRRYALDGMLLGTMATLSSTRGPLTAKYGLHVNEFRREHKRDRDYANYGTKAEANAFAKVSYDVGRWHTYGDAQLRYTNFRYHGDVKIEPIHWAFFNPKIGARFDLSPRSGVYASAGISTREPTRNDLFQGEDNATFAHDLHAVRPERLFDLEAGWDCHGARVDVAANVYAMEFRHEIASTGELSEIGLLLRRNVDRSYRRGLELDAAWQASAKVRLRTVANVSRNRIAAWTQFYDVYDAAGAYLESVPRVLRNVDPLLTPRVIVSQSVDATPLPRVALSVTGRYVGKSYLDNTNDAQLVAPSFFTVDGNVKYDLTPQLRMSLQVNNLTNRRRVFPSGYSYAFLTRDAAGGEVAGGIPYYYPQATRNAVVTLDYRK